MRNLIILMLVLTMNMKAADLQEFRVPLMSAPPSLDGKLAADEWREAVGFDGMMQASKKSLDERRCRVWIGATATDFYVALQSELPPESGLLTNETKNISNVVFDSSFEVWVSPQPDDEARQYFQGLFNSLGRGVYQIHTVGGGKDVPGWNGGWEIANGFTESDWITEVRIPIEKLAAGRKSTDGRWSISVCRNWKQPWVQSSAPGTFKGVDTRFVFDAATPVVVQQQFTTDPFTRDIQAVLTCRNVRAEAVKVEAAFELERNSMPAIPVSKELTLGAGESGELTLNHEEHNSDAFKLSARVQAGEAVLFQRSVSWAQPRTKRWDTVKVIKRPIECKVAHFPYLRKLRLQVDIGGMPEGAQVERVTAVLRKQWESEALATFSFDRFDAEGVQEDSFDVPELEGKFEIELTASGEGVPAEPLHRTFVRKRYDWERNNLGKSTTVYPPFEPITLEDGVLRTVLREHTLDGSGLPAQVVATGEALLAGAIVLKAGGQPLAATGYKVVEQAAHQVRTESRLTGPGIAGSLAGSWDYDGTLRVDLTLEPTGEELVESLVLEVPLRDELMPMVHAMTEGIRQGPTSDRLREGEGVIWHSRLLTTGLMPDGFCSYLFLGDALRGISWFAENDRNWGWDRKTPNLEIERRDGVLTLRVFLINAPTKIEAPRTLTFGLLAAPVKPRIANWRTFWWDHNCTVLGTSINWLAAPGICGCVYPAGKDVHFWRMIARANVEEVPKEEIEATIQRGLPYVEPYEREDTWIRHVRHNVGGSRRGKFQIFYYNRAVTQVEEEYATFMNEWVLEDYPEHEFRPQIHEIKIVPSESYNDFALWWYKKSFEYGRNQGVYWDNWYLRPSFNRTMTDAYGEPGAVTPATGLWGMRELCKRTFVMMNELGMIPVTMPHMTSTNILPMHSFATVQYDWEWKYSTGDVQYRHSREYLQLCSNGELAGIIGVPLHDHGDQATDEWVQRTFCGVALVHELQTNGAGAVWKTLRDPLLPILRDASVKVYRYFDRGEQPVAVGGGDVSWIAYSIPGEESRIILCSYDEAEVEVEVKIDAEALGLTGDLAVENYETGAGLPVVDGVIRLPLVKHGVAGLRVSRK